jgi:hypothetical protein
MLHGIAAAIWAAAYLWLGALESPLEAILYSVDSMSTRGASGLMLHPHWRMMGGARIRRWRVVVWYQHSLYFLRDAGVLADAFRSRLTPLFSDARCSLELRLGFARRVGIRPSSQPAIASFAVFA